MQVDDAANASRNGVLNPAPVLGTEFPHLIVEGLAESDDGLVFSIGVEIILPPDTTSDITSWIVGVP